VRSDKERVIAAINGSRYIWRPAEAISKQTGLSIRRARKSLATTSAAMILQTPRKNLQGYALYTTLDHLMHSSGVMQRDLGTRESS
jgi:hypothetical protein